MATRAITRYRTRYVTRARRRAAGMTLPMAVLAGFAVPLTHAYHGYQIGGIGFAGETLAKVMTGWDMKTNTFQFGELRNGLLPVVAGILVHKFIGGKLGVNRALAKAGVPFVRL